MEARDPFTVANSSCIYTIWFGIRMHFSVLPFSYVICPKQVNASALLYGYGFSDPHVRYQPPPMSVFSYGDISHVSAGKIISGFRIDFIEVRLDGFKSVREIQIDISGMQGGEAELNVQVWKLITAGKDDETKQKLISAYNPEHFLVTEDSDTSSLVISADELEIIDRLGFVITRLDMDEIQDPVGGVCDRPGSGG